MIQSRIDESQLKKFNQHSQKLNKIFSEMITRRVGAGISKGQIYIQLSKRWGLDGITAQGGNNVSQTVTDIESIDYLERLVIKPFYTKEHLYNRTQDKAQTYSLRLSHYLTYIGYSEAESKEIFGVLEELDSRLVFVPNDVKPYSKNVQRREVQCQK